MVILANMRIDKLHHYPVCVHSDFPQFGLFFLTRTKMIYDILDGTVSYCCGVYMTISPGKNSFIYSVNKKLKSVVSVSSTFVVTGNK